MKVLLVLPVSENNVSSNSGINEIIQKSMVHAEQQMSSLIKCGIDIEPLYVDGRKSLTGLISFGLKLRKLSAKPSIKIVHAMWGTSLGFITVLFSKKPVVISFCGSDLLGVRNTKGKITFNGKINRILSKMSSFFCSAIITKSSQMKNELWQIVQKKTFIIPNGVDSSLFRPIEKKEARKAIGIEYKRPIILFFYTEGQVAKNPKLAYEVFNIVKQKNSEVELLIVRGISHDQLVYYYNASDVMLLTSFHEGSNNSTKEAIFCNLPIVTVDVGDASERLKNIENSFVIKEFDAEQIADKVIEILRNCERSNGREVSDELKTEFIANKIIEVYNKAIVNYN